MPDVLGKLDALPAHDSSEGLLCCVLETVEALNRAAQSECLYVRGIWIDPDHSASIYVSAHLQYDDKQDFDAESVRKALCHDNVLYGNHTFVRISVHEIDRDSRKYSAMPESEYLQVKRDIHWT